LVHDLVNRKDLREQLETVVKAAGVAASKSAGVSARIRAYSFSYYKVIQETGDFETVLQGLVGHVQEILVSLSP
jgi:hypothetical protein